MRQLKCPNCAANVPIADARDGFVGCEFCGTSFQIPGRGATAGGARRKGGGGPIVVLLAVVVVVIILTGAVAGILASLGGGAIVAGAALEQERSAPKNTEWTPPPEPVLRPSDLADLKLGGGYKKLEVDGYTPGRETDTVQAVAVLMDALEEWSPDVRIERLGFDGVTQDGDLDLTVEDRSIDLRTTSPARREAARKLMEVSDEDHLTELRVSVEAGRIEVLPGHATDHELKQEDPAPLTFGCSLPDAMAVWKEHELPMRPHYQIIVQYIEGDDWPRPRPGYWRMLVGAEKGDLGKRMPYLDPEDCSIRK